MNASVNHNQETTRQHIQLLERQYRAVKGSFEMLTVFEQPNLKSAQAMIEDARALLDAAEQLHAAIAAMEGEQ
jgi:cob(I)alamin adenosyltransferase